MWQNSQVSILLCFYLHCCIFILSDALLWVTWPQQSRLWLHFIIKRNICLLHFALRSALSRASLSGTKSSVSKIDIFQLNLTHAKYAIEGTNKNRWQNDSISDPATPTRLTNDVIFLWIYWRLRNDSMPKFDLNVIIILYTGFSNCFPLMLITISYRRVLTISVRIEKVIRVNFVSVSKFIKRESSILFYCI